MSQVSDFNVANASGASVRADINAILDAIKTNNAGGTDPSNPEAFMFYADTADSNKLKIRNSANNGFTDIGLVNEPNLGLLPKAGGTMTGQLLADDGSGAASPAIAFDTDPDTGIYRVSSNSIGFATAGVLRVQVSNSGIDMIDGLPIRFQDSSGAPFVSLKSPSSLAGNIDLTLPATIVNGGYLQTNAAGVLSFQIIEGVPTGSVFCIAVATVPTGYVECNGGSYARTGTYAALFAIIGTTYGAADSSHFNVPDLRGEFIRGFDNGKGTDSGRNVGSSQGSANLQHNHSASTSTSIGNHQHNVDTLNEFASTHGTWQTVGGYRQVHIGGTARKPKTSSASLSASSSTTVNNSGGSESRPRNIAMMYVIKI